MIFRQLRLLGDFDLPNMFDEKKRRSSLEMDIPGIEHVQNFRVLPLKNGVDFCAEKSVICISCFKYLVSV